MAQCMARTLDFHEGAPGSNGAGEVLKVIICVHCVTAITYFKQLSISECIQYSVNMTFARKIQPCPNMAVRGFHAL